MANSNVSFNEIKINPLSGKPLFRVFFVYTGNKSNVIEAFQKLDVEMQNDIKDLIIKMATNEDYKSPKINL